MGILKSHLCLPRGTEESRALPPFLVITQCPPDCPQKEGQVAFSVSSRATQAVVCGVLPGPVSGRLLPIPSAAALVLAPVLCTWAGQTFLP